MIEESAKTIHEAFFKATQLISSWKTSDDPEPYCWFRGVTDKTHQLLPGAYRRPKYEEFEPLVTFSQEGGAYADVGHIGDWDTYYLAQHHGIPTRLLDWTESFSAALFFALDEWSCDTQPCVWLLRPCALNQSSIGWSGIIAPNNFPKELGIWLPSEIKKPSHSILQAESFTYDNRYPLAIYPRKSNRRIVAQQGTFTVHGRDRSSLQDYIAKNVNNADTVIARISFSLTNIDEARRDLEMLGVRRSSIYPDIDNYVKQLRSVYGW